MFSFSQRLFFLFLSSILTFIGNKIASVPSDEDHNLGHGKAEYIYSMLISIAMFLMALKVITSSVKSLIFNEKLLSLGNFSQICNHKTYQNMKKLVIM